MMLALLQLLPALAGSMSQTAQPLPRGVRVTAKLAVAWLVPVRPVMTCRTVTVIGDRAGGQVADLHPLVVAAAVWRAALRWARTPGVPAAWARAGYSELGGHGPQHGEPGGRGLPPGPGVPGGGEPARESGGGLEPGRGERQDRGQRRRCRGWRRAGRGGGVGGLAWRCRAGRRLREQRATAARRPAAASSVAVRPMVPGRLVIAGLPGAGCARQGVPGGRGRVGGVPGQAAGRGRGLTLGLGAGGRGGRGELG